MDEVEFASPAWFALLREHLRDVVAEAGVPAGTTFSICEVAHHPPAHLALDGTDLVAWWFRVDGPAVTCEMGLRNDLDHLSEGDYDAVRAQAKVVYGDDPEVLDELRRRNAAGADRGDRRALAIPEALREALVVLHDRLARRTR